MEYLSAAFTVVIHKATPEELSRRRAEWEHRGLAGKTIPGFYYVLETVRVINSRWDLFSSGRVRMHFMRACVSVSQSQVRERELQKGQTWICVTESDLDRCLAKFARVHFKLRKGGKKALHQKQKTLLSVPLTLNCKHLSTSRGWYWLLLYEEQTQAGVTLCVCCLLSRLFRSRFLFFVLFFSVCRCHRDFIS